MVIATYLQVQPASLIKTQKANNAHVHALEVVETNWVNMALPAGFV